MSFWDKLRSAVAGPNKEEQSANQQAATRARRQQMTVLVIDDDPQILEALKPLLEGEGYTVLTSSSGAKGLNMLRYGARDIRLVLLDYSMPSLDGMGTLKFARQISPKAKVVALTGMELAMLPAEFVSGVDVVMTKPFQTADLLAKINALIDAPPAPTA